MWSFINATVPMLVLFSIPVLIPLLAIAVGTVADIIRPPRPTAAEEAVRTARARSAPWRTEMKRLADEQAQIDAVAPAPPLPFPDRSEGPGTRAAA